MPAGPRTAGGLAGWLAAVGAAEAPNVRAVVAGADIEAPFAPGMSVGECAFAVDAGREAAARAAREGVEVLVGRAAGADAQALSDWLRAPAR